MAFIGQETVRKQQRHNFLWRMYSLIAVFVHFNRFIDLKINFHTNPYNLASSMLLWFWAPCDTSEKVGRYNISQIYASNDNSLLTSLLLSSSACVTPTGESFSEATFCLLEPCSSSMTEISSLEVKMIRQLNFFFLHPEGTRRAC